MLSSLENIPDLLSASPGLLTTNACQLGEVCWFTVLSECSSINLIGACSVELLLIQEVLHLVAPCSRKNTTCARAAKFLRRERNRLLDMSALAELSSFGGGLFTNNGLQCIALLLKQAAAPHDPGFCSRKLLLPGEDHACCTTRQLADIGRSSRRQLKLAKGSPTKKQEAATF